jgi:hypothetical protein
METLHKPEHNLHNEKNFYKQQYPYYKTMHKDWRVWVGVVLIMVALTIYIMSVDFTIQPAVPPIH